MEGSQPHEFFRNVGPPPQDDDDDDAIQEDETEEIMCKFLSEYNKLSVRERGAYGFPENLAKGFFNDLTLGERAHFIARASNFLTSLREARERTKPVQIHTQGSQGVLLEVGEQSPKDYTDFLAKFLVQYEKLDHYQRRVLGFPLMWDERTFDRMDERARRIFLENAGHFLRTIKEGREAESQAKEKEYALQKRMEDLCDAGITTKSLLQRFSARTPEERTYIFRWVFGLEAQPEHATWRFYASWAQVEEEYHDTNKGKYLQYVDKLCQALKTFE
jgi:hypothetical protein